MRRVPTQPEDVPIPTVPGLGCTRGCFGSDWVGGKLLWFEFFFLYILHFLNAAGRRAGASCSTAGDWLHMGYMQGRWPLSLHPGLLSLTVWDQGME